MNINKLCQIIGLALAGSAGPVPPALQKSNGMATTCTKDVYNKGICLLVTLVTLLVTIARDCLLVSPLCINHRCNSNQSVEPNLHYESR